MHARIMGGGGGGGDGGVCRYDKIKDCIMDITDDGIR